MDEIQSNQHMNAFLTALGQGLICFFRPEVELIGLRGPDAAVFLQGMLTNDVNKLKVGQVQSNLITQTKGKILHHVELLQEGQENFILLTEPSEANAVGGILHHYQIREEFVMSKLSPDLKRVDLMGAQAADCLKQLGAVEDEGPFFFEDSQITVASFPLLQYDRRVLLVPHEAVSGLTRAIQQQFPQSLSMQQEQWQNLCTCLHLPQFGLDYGNNSFPQEAGLMDHISYKKGCYIGQEPHARMLHRGHPNKISVAVRIPVQYRAERGSELFAEGSEVGEVTSLCAEDIQGKQHGIALVKYTCKEKKSDISLDVEGGHQIEWGPLPTSLNVDV